MTQVTSIALQMGLGLGVTRDVGGWSVMERATFIALDRTGVTADVGGRSSMTQATTIDLDGTNATGLCQQLAPGAKEIGNCVHMQSPG